MKTGIVIESTGSHYVVLTPEGRTLETKLRGKLRLNGSRTTNPVAVGDRVRYEETAGTGATITEVEPRRNYLIRRASNLSKEAHVIASNLDRALIVATLFSPVTNTEFIDRFLVTCEAYAIPAAIVLNKVDLAPKSWRSSRRSTKPRVTRSIPYRPPREAVWRHCASSSPGRPPC